MARGGAAFFLVMASAVVNIAFACENSDATCHSLEAMRLTNEVRTRHGKSGSLRPGPQAMLDNAVKHSRIMAETGAFEHQDLGSAAREVQCGMFIS